MSAVRLQLWWKRARRKMWLRAAVYGALGIMTALFGAQAKWFIPQDLAGRIGVDSVGNLLAILASSMLAVATFSLSIMVSAYAAAASGATPRATTLLIADRSAQGALATFIGAFLFSVVGLIALSTGIYGDSGRVVLFAATVMVIVVITVTLLRWIERLTSFGRVAATVNLVEDATAAAIDEHLADPWLGARAGQSTPPAGGVPLDHDRIGYVELIDVAALDDCARRHGCELHLALRPGSFAAPGRPVVWIVGTAGSDSLVRELRAAIRIADERSFDQDPRFGLVVLSEIASRALSPAVNDPGTAIDVIGTLTRLLCRWASLQLYPGDGDGPASANAVYMHPLAVEDVLDDAFPAIARDGAGLVEVGLRLQKAFAALMAVGNPSFAGAAAHQAREAMDRARGRLDHPGDLRLLESLHQDAPPAAQ
jgi:uncharacterized membrane protein